MLSTKPCKKLIFSLILVILNARAWGAACCGGGFAAPSLITGDDRAMLTATYSQSRVDTDVFSNGLWQKREGRDELKLYKLEAARIFDDRYQYGFSLPVQTREKSGTLGGHSTGLADISLQVGYEYLPDWDYNPWRPHGVGFLALTLPTGQSVYETADSFGLDSRGRGFWALGIGTALTKNWLVMDANATVELHRSFHRTVHNAQVDGTVKPGTGASASIGSGYNYKNFRLGANVTWLYEDAIAVEGTPQSAGSAQRVASAGVLASYLFADNVAGTFSYADQTLLGSPSNTTLTKSFALSIQRRWAR